MGDIYHITPYFNKFIYHCDLYYKQGDPMIKINDIKVNKTNPEVTNLFLQFECEGVNEERCDFLKDRLDTYKHYIDNEYSLEYEMEHNEFAERLLIGINISIPDHLIPKDFEEGSDLIIEQIKLFRNFYEAQNEIYKKSNLPN